MAYALGMRWVTYGLVATAVACGPKPASQAVTAPVETAVADRPIHSTTLDLICAFAADPGVERIDVHREALRGLGAPLPPDATSTAPTLTDTISAGNVQLPYRISQLRRP